MADKKVVVAGATGLVGNAALRHFGAAGGCEVVALSRRKPRELHGARHVPIDLTDAAQCTRPQRRCRTQPISSMPRSMKRRTWSMAGAIRTRSEPTI